MLVHSGVTEKDGFFLRHVPLARDNGKNPIPFCLHMQFAPEIEVIMRRRALLFIINEVISNVLHKFHVLQASVIF